MPRGAHFKKVDDKEIKGVFKRDDLPRKALSPKQVADYLNDDVLEEDTIEPESVRQRMHKIDGLETIEIGGAHLWHEKGVEVFRAEVGAAIHDIYLFNALAALTGKSPSEVHRTLAAERDVFGQRVVLLNLLDTLGFVFMSTGMVWFASTILGLGVGFTSAFVTVIGVVVAFQLAVRTWKYHKNENTQVGGAAE